MSVCSLGGESVEKNVPDSWTLISLCRAAHTSLCFLENPNCLLSSRPLTPNRLETETIKSLFCAHNDNSVTVVESFLHACQSFMRLRSSRLELNVGRLLLKREAAAPPPPPHTWTTWVICLWKPSQLLALSTFRRFMPLFV